jgi:hypothetical protein
MSVIYPLPSKEQLRILKACEKHNKMMLKKASERIMEKLKKEEAETYSEYKTMKEWFIENQYI